MSNLKNIRIDLEILSHSTLEDYEAKRWASYPGYIVEFNRLLEEAQKSGLGINIDKVNPVSLDKVAAFGWVGTGSPAEQAKLRELVDKSARLLVRVSSAMESLSSKKVSSDPNFLIERLCNRFHSVARRLCSRREERPTLKVEDEYDVQDLFYALLCLFFDDIRSEECTPSYAGGSSRMDFLLKREQLVIEVKKTRKGLSNRELGEQLIVDIERYAKHQDCKKLVCFVYDPEERISNPRGVEMDLMSRSTTELKVLVFIRPTGQ